MSCLNDSLLILPAVFKCGIWHDALNLVGPGAQGQKIDVFGFKTVKFMFIVLFYDIWKLKDKTYHVVLNLCRFLDHKYVRTRGDCIKKWHTRLTHFGQWVANVVS